MENFNFLCSHISAVDIIHLAQRRTYDDLGLVNLYHLVIE